MRKIAASEAKTHFLRLLDEVEHGEELQISRHGRLVARIVPETNRRQQEIQEAIEAIKALRQRAQPTTKEELVAWVHEGHER